METPFFCLPSRAKNRYDSLTTPLEKSRLYWLKKIQPTITWVKIFCSHYGFYCTQKAMSIFSYWSPFLLFSFSFFFLFLLFLFSLRHLFLLLFHPRNPPPSTTLFVRLVASFHVQFSGMPSYLNCCPSSAHSLSLVSLATIFTLGQALTSLCHCPFQSPMSLCKAKNGCVSTVTLSQP